MTRVGYERLVPADRLNAGLRELVLALGDPELLRGPVDYGPPGVSRPGLAVEREVP